jgi:hypothetical protein
MATAIADYLIPVPAATEELGSEAKQLREHFAQALSVARRRSLAGLGDHELGWMLERIRESEDSDRAAQLSERFIRIDSARFVALFDATPLGSMMEAFRNVSDLPAVVRVRGKAPRAGVNHVTYTAQRFFKASERVLTAHESPVPTIPESAVAAAEQAIEIAPNARMWIVFCPNWVETPDPDPAIVAEVGGRHFLIALWGDDKDDVGAALLLADAANDRKAAQ